jgi:hypothetical protein
MYKTSLYLAFDLAKSPNLLRMFVTSHLHPSIYADALEHVLKRTTLKDMINICLGILLSSIDARDNKI